MVSFKLMLERKEGREKEKHLCEKHQSVAFRMCPRNPTYILGMCSDWESNPQPFGVWDGAPTN